MYISFYTFFYAYLEIQTSNNTLIMQKIPMKFLAIRCIIPVSLMGGIMRHIPEPFQGHAIAQTIYCNTTLLCWLANTI